MNTTTTHQKPLQPEEKSLWRYFVEAFTKNYINFSGRARRREYWGALLFFSLIQFVLLVVGFGFAFKSIMAGVKPGQTNGLILIFHFLLISLPYCYLLLWRLCLV